jgi:hypothetical protein
MLRMKWLAAALVTVTAIAFPAGTKIKLVGQPARWPTSFSRHEALMRLLSAQSGA